MSKDFSIGPLIPQFQSNYLYLLTVNDNQQKLKTLVQKWQKNLSSIKNNILALKPRPAFNYAFPALNQSDLEEITMQQKNQQQNITLLQKEFETMQMQYQDFYQFFRDSHQDIGDIHHQYQEMEKTSLKQDEQLEQIERKAKKLTQEIIDIQILLQELKERKKRIENKEIECKIYLQQLDTNINDLNMVCSSFCHSFIDLLKFFKINNFYFISPLKDLVFKTINIYKQKITTIFYFIKKKSIICYHFLADLEVKIVKIAGMVLFALLIIPHLSSTTNFIGIVGCYICYRYQSTIFNLFSRANFYMHSRLSNQI